MRITKILERPVGLRVGSGGGPANAVVNFSSHTVSLVAVCTDVIRAGRPVAGLAFDSIGRFAQSGILRDRMIPRLAAASPDALLDASGRIDPAAVLACALADEKPGGHGDRAAAAAALELACWDLNAKLRDEHPHLTIAAPLRAAAGHDGGGVCRRRLLLPGSRPRRPAHRDARVPRSRL